MAAQSRLLVHQLGNHVFAESLASPIAGRQGVWVICVGGNYVVKSVCCPMLLACVLHIGSTHSVFASLNQHTFCLRHSMQHGLCALQSPFNHLPFLQPTLQQQKWSLRGWRPMMPTPRVGLPDMRLASRVAWHALLWRMLPWSTGVMWCMRHGICLHVRRCGKQGGCWHCEIVPSLRCLRGWGAKWRSLHSDCHGGVMSHHDCVVRVYNSFRPQGPCVCGFSFLYIVFVAKNFIDCRPVLQHRG